MPIRSILAGVGGYLPNRVLTNDELARSVETSDEWIRERTGIRQRHIAAPHETAAHMGTAAARAALADARATPDEVDAIILATSTPDQAFPATALRVQAALGVTNGFGFDVAAACAGFIYALSIADGMIRTGQVRGALVIGSEVYSRILNWQDRGTCVLFGDGAGAVFLRAGHGSGRFDRGVLSTHLHSQGALGDILYVDGAVGQRDKPAHLVMNGREVFRHAVVRLAEVVEEALAANGLERREIDWLVPHQANLRIISQVALRLDIPMERFVLNIDRYGNTSSASIPIALDEGVRDGRIKPSDTVLMCALGAGISWGSALVRM